MRVLLDEPLVYLDCKVIVTLSQLIDRATELLDEGAELWLDSHVEGLLYDVVPILIAEQIEILGLIGHQAPNHFLVHRLSVEFEALLNDIGTEFLLAKCNQIGHELLADNLVNFLNLKFQHILYNVIGKGILDKC